MRLSPAGCTRQKSTSLSQGPSSSLSGSQTYARCCRATNRRRVRFRHGQPSPEFSRPAAWPGPSAPDDALRPPPGVGPPREATLKALPLDRQSSLMALVMRWLVENWHVLFAKPWDAMALVLLAVISGAWVGTERQRREKAAGVRTMALVALGSCTFTLVGYAFTSNSGDSGPSCSIWGTR